MKRVFSTLCVGLLLAGAAAAVEVTFKDGTVISAESYRITGSYVMLKLADGRQVAYDAADVDLAALRAAEAAAETTEADQDTGGAGSAESIGGGRSLKDAAAVGEESSGGLTISDRDVKHVRGSGVLGDDEEAETSADTGAIPEGFEQGGGVVLNSINVTPAGDGSWQVAGEVVNRSPTPVMDVRVKLETAGLPGGEPWRSEVSVTSRLGPDESGTFVHQFQAAVPQGRAHPDVRASVIWMRQENRRTPDYTKAGGVPHPSNLPVDRGGVTGADARPTPRQ
jgi:hypothetical protein